MMDVQADHGPVLFIYFFFFNFLFIFFFFMWHIGHFRIVRASVIDCELKINHKSRNVRENVPSDMCTQ